MIDSMTRDDVLSALGEISKHFESCTKETYGSTREMFHCWMNAADWAAAYLNDPVRHGKWTYCNCFEKGRYQCSECAHWIDAGLDNNYCPNCGAKMDGDENATD